MSEHAHSERLEPGGVSNGWVSLAAAGFMTLLIVSVVVFGIIYESAVPANHTPTVQQFPRPRQEAHPANELHKLLSRQHKELSSYRWVNAQHTLVAIPIDRAMKLIVKRGAHAFDPIVSQQQSPPAGGKP